MVEFLINYERQIRSILEEAVKAIHEDLAIELYETRSADRFS